MKIFICDFGHNCPFGSCSAFCWKSHILNSKAFTFLNTFPEFFFCHSRSNRESSGSATRAQESGTESSSAPSYTSTPPLPPSLPRSLLPPSRVVSRVWSQRDLALYIPGIPARVPPRLLIIASCSLSLHTEERAARPRGPARDTSDPRGPRGETRAHHDSWK